VTEALLVGEAVGHDDVVIARQRRRLPIRRALMVPAALVLFVLAWEGYKAIGPADGGKIFGSQLIPRADDRTMPHVIDMFRRFGKPEVGGADKRTVFAAVLEATWYSFRVAMLGFVLGVLFGLVLATVMARLNLVRRALLPYLVVSQTVPLIALAPLTVSWGGKLNIGGFHFEKWMSAALLSSFLAFFPVAVGALRGFSSPKESSLELMNSYAASWFQTFRKLRFPSAVPYLVPALRLAASAAVIGVVVSEISIGLRFGIGRLIISYSQEATSDPAKVYTAVMGAVVLGLVMAGLVAAIDNVLTRNRPMEASS
jgi:NitT/TauT family transport system permease protein